MRSGIPSGDVDASFPSRERTQEHLPPSEMISDIEDSNNGVIYEPLKGRSFYRAQRFRSIRCEMIEFQNRNYSSPDSSLERRASRSNSGGTCQRSQGYRRSPV